MDIFTPMIGRSLTIPFAINLEKNGKAAATRAGVSGD